MRYRLLIVIGVLAVLVMPTVSAAAPIGLAPLRAARELPEGEACGNDAADGRIGADASC